MVKVDRKELAGVLAFLGKAVPGKSILPILQSIKVVLDDSTLEMQASNLVVHLTREIPTDGDDQWETCVPFETLKGIVSVDSGNEVGLSLKGDKLTVTVGAAKSNIKCLPAEEFPLVDTSQYKRVATFDAQYLKKYVERVAWAAYTGDDQPNKNSVYFDASNGSLALVALDSIGQLAMIETGHKIDDQFSFIMPLKATACLSELYGLTDILLGQNQVAFVASDMSVVSQLVDGDYFPYRDVIKAEFTSKAVMYQTEFANALRQADVFAKDDAHVAEMIVDPLEAQVIVGSRLTQMGDGNTPIKCVSLVSDDNFPILFNANYMTNAVSHAGARFSLNMNGPLVWIVIRSDPFDDGWTGLIVPMITKGAA